MKIDAFVLIGGRSSRLGRDKASLLLGGVTLAERMALTLEGALSPRSIRLVAANGQQFQTGLAFQSDLPFVLDVHRERGPFGGPP